MDECVFFMGKALRAYGNVVDFLLRLWTTLCVCVTCMLMSPEAHCGGVIKASPLP